MEKDIRRLPDSELEVMLTLWQAGDALHTGEILQRLDPEKKKKLQAVQMILSRLAYKGFVQCEKTGRLNYYTALVEEERYRSQETASFIHKLYGSSPARLVATLVKDKAITREELEEIRSLLEQED